MTVRSVSLRRVDLSVRSFKSVLLLRWTFFHETSFFFEVLESVARTRYNNSLLVLQRRPGNLEWIWCSFRKWSLKADSNCCHEFHITPVPEQNLEIRSSRKCNDFVIIFLIGKRAGNHFLRFECIVLVQSLRQNLLVWLFINLVDDKASLWDSSLTNS
jgi:hypothetical protein